jgi:serine protease Do
MFTLGNRFFAALAIVGSAIAFTFVGITLSNADEPKAPDFSELRDAVNAAAKRGENVDEIRKALETLQKSLANGFTAPAAGKTLDPSPELVALRETVEAAARKGENVEEIRKQLDAVEKTLTGKVQVKPKPLPPVDQPNDPFPNPQRGRLQPNPFPNPPGNPPLLFGPGANGLDAELIQKATELQRKAAELMLKNPNDAEAQKLLTQARDLMLQGMLGGKRAQVAPQMIFPDIGGRGGDRFRLGVRLEAVSELAADQLGLEVARGVGIADVVEGSVAQKVGFKTHDIVLEFAGKPVSSIPEDFTRLVASVKGGEKVDAVVMRKGKKLEIKGIVLPEQAQAFPQPAPFDGLQFPQLNPAPRPQRKPARGDDRGRADNSVMYSVTNGQIVIRVVQEGIQYVIQGDTKDDSIEPSRITVIDGDKKTDVEKLDKVPEEYRRTVDELINGFKGRKPSRP